MNEERREKLRTLVAQLEELKEEERHSYDSMPEGLQQAPNGQASETAGDHLDQAIDEINSAIEQKGA